MLFGVQENGDTLAPFQHAALGIYVSADRLPVRPIANATLRSQSFVEELFGQDRDSEVLFVAAGLELPLDGAAPQIGVAREYGLEGSGRTLAWIAVAVAVTAP